MDASVVRRPPFGNNPLVGERGTDTRRRILGAALEVFGKAGFAESRVELITELAGCSRPAFYQYFSSKDDVFWALARQLGHEMVALAERLERVTPDSDGLAHLTEWVGQFMALHEAWSPVFASFQAASRDHQPEARRSSGIADRTGLALLRAFGVEETTRNATLATNLVSVLIRCSFYAEQSPADTSVQPLVDGVAQLFHRILEGPIEGVNVVRSRPGGRRGTAVAAPEPTAHARLLRPRGEKTRLRLLDAGAAVLPARGYHDARVDDIVAAAGVSHGTFYRYFENKDDFFRVLAEAASSRMIDLIDGLDLDARPDGLRTWLRAWLDAYKADGGVISTWQEMRTNEELYAFSQRVAASVFTRLVRLLERRDFGNAVVDATTLLSLIERVPYSVFTLRFTTEDDAVENMHVAIRRGFLALPA
ncbi:MAG TPA: TetR/AcrR family transcriptional regulator [Acidimicrobiales bacterium]|nr:TetR/AcrR family transcriptional regulator [Acidimicrobiales bacterium]